MSCPRRIPAASVFIEDLILSADGFGWDLETDGLLAAAFSAFVGGAACKGGGKIGPLYVSRVFTVSENDEFIQRHTDYYEIHN